ncbi:Uncharacterized protein family (UPF0114) [Abeliophyllum distichum]|uniref:Uncharacterized protein family (UPF0114) n=1 Tax=Abeliophyllum distichum TaxID=126358 RepID=A0ABD1STW0_9LAMI
MSFTRLVRMSRPLALGPSHDSSSNSTCSSMVSRSRTLICSSKAGLRSKNVAAGGDEKKTVAVKAAGGSACVVISEPKTDTRVDLALLIANASDVILQWRIMITKRRPWKFNIQMFVEKAIVDCRFFTLLAIGGSLLSSILCFVEGCFLIVESYFQYFRAISQMSQQGHVVQLLIQAIDVFLLGTAMLIFGMSLYVIFVGTKNLKGKGSQHLRPSLFGNFNVETIQARLGMQSVMQAKSKMGHAVIMILLVEVLEKFKSIPVVTGWDLTYFAAAIFVSSASIFLLSKLSIAGTDR